LVVAAGLFFGLLVLWVRVAWLQVARHAHYADRAAVHQVCRIVLPPARGELRDRHGEALARDLVTYSVSADPKLVTNRREAARLLARLLRRDARAVARDLAPGKRYVWLARSVPPEVGQRVAEAGIPGVYVSTGVHRDYPLGAVASELLGRTSVDRVGVEGVELQLDEELRGRAGWATRFRDGRGRTIALQRGLRRSPEDGRHVVLTIDAEFQSIVENHLARAVTEFQARRGFALFLDPRTGEILASVTVPHLAVGKTRNLNFTDQFEPGSTFKVVVAGAALEEGIVRPDEWFEASPTGAALVAPGTIFHDVHKEAGYKFRDAVRWSSNIVMGRLAGRLGSERLYRYATDLGFGSMTGLSFPGEASGKLRSPSSWSGRSCPTIAIGQEVSVTPLQLALAYATIANGGVAMQPMLVREIQEANGRVVRRFTPQAMHRVFSDATTRQLREMLTAVVDSGTGKAARCAEFAVAGKTGTAQKFDVKTHSYGRYFLSSFAGFVPADRPSIVGVVVIDEPTGRRYYGGDVAAPVFKAIVQDVGRLPEGPLGAGVLAVAARPPAAAVVAVPDLRQMTPDEAVDRLRGIGLHARLRGGPGRVREQEPPAGAMVERGIGVFVHTGPLADSTGRTLPDLAGLTAREALRRLTALGVRTRIEGSGWVVSQDPPAGAVLPLARSCRLRCTMDQPEIDTEVTAAPDGKRAPVRAAAAPRARAAGAEGRGSA
jgi:stage V sporulation protein D (sporulation-specific penicillin-binding protein)